jgi:hypothetical protein
MHYSVAMFFLKTLPRYTLAGFEPGSSSPCLGTSAQESFYLQKRHCTHMYMYIQSCTYMYIHVTSCFFVEKWHDRFYFWSATSCAYPPPQPCIFSINLLRSTTLWTGMTGISLHMQWPLTSQSHGSFSQRDGLLLRIKLHVQHDHFVALIPCWRNEFMRLSRCDAGSMFLMSPIRWKRRGHYRKGSGLHNWNPNHCESKFCI